MSDLDSEVIFLEPSQIETAIAYYIEQIYRKTPTKVILEIVSERYNNGFRETKNIATVFVK